MANNWTVNVGNVGNVWTGTNGAQAMRQFGQWKAESVADVGRASGEPVTLLRNDEPVREYAGHRWFLYRLGDGNEGNFPRFYVRVQNDVCPYRYLSACVANRYIPGSATRRYIVRELHTDGEPDYGINAWVNEGPKGEQPFGAAWITAEFEPTDAASMFHDASGRSVFNNPRDHLDRSALRMLKGA
jgi:hypothetical protein